MKLFTPMSATRYALLASASFVVFAIAWIVLSNTLQSAAIFLPTPWAVAESGLDLFRLHAFHKDILASVWRVSFGFVAAVFVALPVGVFAGTYKPFDAIVQPFNDFVRYMPVAAFVPLTILWVGVGDIQKITIIFLGTVFQLVPLVTDTVRTIPRHLVDLAYTMGCCPRKVILRVVVPWAAPVVYDHCRVALGWGWSYLVVAELVAATSGIGHVIIQSQRFIQTDNVMAGILAIGIIGLVSDQLFRLPKRRFFPWE